MNDLASTELSNSSENLQNIEVTEKPTELQLMSLQELKKELMKGPLYEPPTEHTFHAGMYARQVYSPAGTILIGKIHKKEHFFLLASGVVTLTTDQGPFTMAAPYLMTSEAGAQRAIYVNEDAIFVTFHRVDSTNLEEVEEELAVQDPESPYGTSNKLKVEYLT